MVGKILVTGASGLLGREIVRVFSEGGGAVAGQYARHRPRTTFKVQWIQGDFSVPAGVRRFIHRHREILAQADILINNYGPITHREIARITAEDLQSDFTGNVVPAFEITRHLIRESPLKVVVNILFHDAGVIKAYRNILPYAIAKTSQLMVARSLAAAFPSVRFLDIFTPPLKGGKVPLARRRSRSPAELADEIYRRVVEESL